MFVLGDIALYCFSNIVSRYLFTIMLHLFLHSKQTNISLNFVSFIQTMHSYETTVVEGTTVKPSTTKMQFKTERKVGKTGVMLVGLGGNNGW